MLCVTFTALVQRLIAMVKAISTAASVTIPAGETTWGAVFIANGLQLILAVLLIVLGLNIVFHSFSAYKKAEHNSDLPSFRFLYDSTSARQTQTKRAAAPCYRYCSSQFNFGS